MTNDKPFKNIKGIFNIMQAVSIFGKRPQFVYPIPKRYRKLIEDCWSDNPEKRPSFDQIVYQLKNDEDFITEADVDKDEYLNFIDFVDDYQNLIKPEIKPISEVFKTERKVDYKSREVQLEIKNEDKIIEEIETENES